ncbi:MAG TPA: anti-sigma factor antagonist [Clostridiales bacterium]|nr:anti-sigma factor antagonist [Clostridiales bacterium]
MKCSHKRERCGIVIRFHGELGHHEAAQCVEYLEKTMTLYPTEPIFLDLSGLTFMDSSGIAVVLGAQRNVLGAGQSFCVIGTPPTAMRIFQASGICRRVTFLPALPQTEGEEDDLCTAK